MSTPLFLYDEANDSIGYIKSHLSAPFISGHVSALGGKDRSTIMLAIALEPKATWKNGIFENSRYGQFSIDYTGTMELFSSHGTAKFRKTKVKNVDEVIKKLETWIMKSLGAGYQE